MATLSAQRNLVMMATIWYRDEFSVGNGLGPDVNQAFWRAPAPGQVYRDRTAAYSMMSFGQTSLPRQLPLIHPAIPGPYRIILQIIHILPLSPSWTKSNLAGHVFHQGSREEVP